MRPESAGLDSGSVLQDRRALNESPVRHVRPESAGLDSGLASQTSVCAGEDIVVIIVLAQLSRYMPINREAAEMARLLRSL